MSPCQLLCRRRSAGVNGIDGRSGAVDARDDDVGARLHGDRGDVRVEPSRPGLAAQRDPSLMAGDLAECPAVGPGQRVDARAGEWSLALEVTEGDRPDE